jgi:hypothetical protein
LLEEGRLSRRPSIEETEKDCDFPREPVLSSDGVIKVEDAEMVDEKDNDGGLPVEDEAIVEARGSSISILGSPAL